MPRDPEPPAPRAPAAGASAPPAAAPTLTISRVFRATPERLWAYWTDPAKYAKWLNPAPLDLVIHEWDARPGGRVRFDMPQPDGNPNPQEGVFHRLSPPTELVTGSADKSFLIRVRFEPVDREHTRMRVDVTGLPPEWHAMATEGWNKGLDKLAALLAAGPGPAPGPGFRGLTVERTYPASPERVWRHWTDPALLRRWWAPAGWTTPHCTLDLRPGGLFLFCMRSPAGQDVWARGVYREVVPPTRLAYLDSFADPEGRAVPPSRYGMSPEHPMETLVEVTFAAEGTGTRVTLRHAIAPSVPEAADTRKGWGEMLDRLAQELAGP